MKPRTTEPSIGASSIYSNGRGEKAFKLLVTAPGRLSRRRTEGELATYQTKAWKPELLPSPK